MLTPVYTRQFEKDVKRMERRGLHQAKPDGHSSLLEMPMNSY
jgi:hypothetical protein